MTDKNNIEDVTNSPEDWEDFWYNSESDGQEFVELPPYVEAIACYEEWVVDGKDPQDGEVEIIFAPDLTRLVEDN